MGRPRKHPEGATASDRAREALHRLKASGGARKTFDLSGEAIAALAAIRRSAGDKTDLGVIERVLREERARVLRPDEKS